jgi:serine/threonine protein kinase
MDSKIFLRKYRVSAEEIEAVGESTDTALAYEGEEIESGKKVVVEVVPTALPLSARDQLEAKALAAKKLRHANIPALYDFGIEDDNLVYVTEDFDGTLAEEWVNANGPMPLGPVLRIASQVVSALGAAAFHRIVHRAINPSNLVLVPGQTAEGEWPLVKILHFVGGAQRVSGSDAPVARADKSLPYLSPEQLEDGSVDFRSEIYSLGCTMSFLLTGAPPPVAAKGAIALEPAKTVLPMDTMSFVPKKVSDLIAQMMSANPNARPRDPLAFYRQLQDCLTEVEQRETKPRPATSRPTTSRPATASVSRISVIDPPPRRRSPLKTLARAALILALAALTAFILREYLRHRRVVRAEEPIGIPVGVADALPSATPVTEKAADTMVSIVTRPTPVVADSSSVASGPKNAEADNANARPSPADSVESAPPSQVAVAPMQPRTQDSPADSRNYAPPAITTNKASPPPSAKDLSEVPSTIHAEATPAPVVSIKSEASAVVQQTPPKKTIMHEVRRAEPADDEPEVRRAEPASPHEGPSDSAPKATASPNQQMNSAAKTELSRDVEAEATETMAPVLKRTDSEPEVAAKPPARKTELPAKPKQQTKEKIYLLPGHEFEAPTERLPRGSVRGRFMGVTADGKWMFELPSREIVIVPAPASPP